MLAERFRGAHPLGEGLERAPERPGEDEGAAGRSFFWRRRVPSNKADLYEWYDERGDLPVVALVLAVDFVVALFDALLELVQALRLVVVLGRGARDDVDPRACVEINQ